MGEGSSMGRGRDSSFEGIMPVWGFFAGPHALEGLACFLDSFVMHNPSHSPKIPLQDLQKHPSDSFEK